METACGEQLSMTQQPDVHGTRPELVQFIGEQSREIERLKTALRLAGPLPGHTYEQRLLLSIERLLTEIRDTLRTNGSR